MKALTIILTALLFNVYLTVAGAPLISVDAASIKSIATKSILHKYPDMKSDDLKYYGIRYSLDAEGPESISVTYELPGSAKQEDKVMGGAPTHIIRTSNIVVTMSNDGVVTDITKGWGTKFLSGTK